MDKVKFSYQISLDISESGYLYTFSRQCDKKTDCMSRIEFDICNGFFVRETISGKKDDKKKESDAKSISFQGAITLPKEDANIDGSEKR